MYSGFPLGGALASAVMSWIAVRGSLGNVVTGGDWRTIFYVGGLAPLLVVPIVNVVMPDSLELGCSARSAPSKSSWLEVVFGGGRVVNSLLLWISFFTTLLVLYLLLNWLPALLNSRGFTRSQSFLVQLAFNGGGVPGSVLAGFLMDKGKQTVMIPIIYLGLVICLGLVAMMPTDVMIALTCGAALGAMVMGTQALLYGLAPRCYEATIRGTGVGAAVCMGRIGSVVGPLLGANLVGAGHSTSQVLMAVIPFAIVGGSTAVFLASHVGIEGKRASAGTISR